ncbi:MAG: DUF5671 domain-containing protein [Candidatus Eremiobacteraeota bacterium]|nr:DUF5671 domain-containing protein [Candidatus Eremiobacteraeota bacterium]
MTQTASTASEQLAQFIGTAKNNGLADDFIVSLLRKNGWSEPRVFAAFSAYYADVLGAPIPSRSGRSESARDAFYYLLNFITLGFWTTALGQIFYALIAHWLPDEISNGYNGYSSLRDQITWQAATVLVAFPLFAFVHTRIGRQLVRRPDLYESGVRKWLTYLALVIAALIVLLDAVWFLNALLRGELSLHFLLDSLVLLVLGGGVFAYYLMTIDAPPTEQ